MSRSLSEVLDKKDEKKEILVDVKSQDVKLVLLLGRDLTLDEQKVLSLAGMMLFKFDSQIHGNLSLVEILGKFDGVVVNMLDEKSITWYSEHKHQLNNCKVVYIAKPGSPIVDKIQGLKNTLSANVVLKYLPGNAASKKDLIDKLHDHISRAGTKSTMDNVGKALASLFKCLLL